MNESQVKSIVQNMLQSGQYSVPNVPYHIHNGVDSPILNTPINGMAYASGATTTTSGNDAQIQINTLVFANGINFISGSYGFVVKTAGQYLIIGNANYSSTVSGKEYSNFIDINGDGGNPSAKTYAQASINGGAIGQPVIAILNLNVGDTIQLWTWQNSGSNASVYGGSYLTYLSVAKV